ncbi:TPA: hypothetical protein ACSRD7_003271 [Yersinia enterocolitica]|nr:hypothetical protein [Yersinia enterocolitica]HEN3309652.1 hypothetical protein [Yersinia enterocolitica]
MENFVLWAFIAVITLINGAIVLFGKSFVKGWVEGDIGEYFKIREEKREQDYEVRIKAALIAELFAEWTSLNADRKRLRQLTFEAFLWLPGPLAVELSKILSHKDDAKDIQAYVIEVRKFLLGSDDALTRKNVITFGLSNEERAKVRY